jgi:hypothetical protein
MGRVLTTALAVGSGLIALAFAALVFERWLLKRRPQDAAWTISLVLFCGGAMALAWGNAAGWSSMAFRVFFAFGAILNVPFLASGQLYLLVRRRLADRIFKGLCLISMFALGVTMATPLIRPVPPDRLPKGKEVFGVVPRILAAVGSGVGATVVFGGTVIGIVRLVRARRANDGGQRAMMNRRIGGLVLLALGTLVLSFSGSLNSVFGEMRAFVITLALGVTVLFAGFVLSSR